MSVALGLSIVDFHPFENLQINIQYVKRVDFLLCKGSRKSLTLPLDGAAVPYLEILFG